MRRLFLLVFLAGCHGSSGDPTPVSSPVPVDSARNSNGSLKSFPSAPPDVPGRMHVFQYGDFGPQAMAGQLLGQDCYSFANCCCSEQGDRYDVRVVVYAGVSSDAVRARYPTGPRVGDYRLVEAAEAKRFVAAQLAEVRSFDDPMPSLVADLTRTQRRLAQYFPR